MHVRKNLLTSLASIATVLLVGAVFAVAQEPQGTEEPPEETTGPEAGDEATSTTDAETVPTDGYVVLYQFKGMLNCGLGTGGIAPEPAPGGSADLCVLQTWSVDGWTNVDPTFDAPAGARAVVAELQWGPPTNQLQGETLSLTASTTIDVPFEDGDHQTAAGPSILRLDIPPADPSGTGATHEVRIQPGYDAQSGLVVNQPWELRATVFVGMDVPEGYSAYGAA